jgi:hypothetical protein
MHFISVVNVAAADYEPLLAQHVAQHPAARERAVQMQFVDAAQIARSAADIGRDQTPNLSYDICIIGSSGGI